MKLECRAFPFELRAAAENKIEGYAATFGQLSEPMFGFRERVEAGAFSKSISDSTRDIYALWAHNPDMPLASRYAKSLSLAEDSKGLAFEMVGNSTRWWQDAYDAIRSGVVRHMSFGFSTISDKWENKDEEEIRTLVDVRLYEISPVVFPAYRSTSAEARSLDPADVLKQHRDGAQARQITVPEQRGWGVPEALLVNLNRGRSTKYA